MGAINPVFTIENECQDCYKCLRHCHCKAIRIVEGKASVIPDACVACGECVRICPVHAKKIRSDVEPLRKMLLSGDRIYASVAPSFAGYFPGVSFGQLAAALEKAGFAGASETAHGAEAVSAELCAWLAEKRPPLAISSACPAVVDYIVKYRPEYAQFITPVPSPVLAHCRLLKRKYGNNIKVAFFGPCAAKKNEADRHGDLLDLALVFPALEQILAERGAAITEETSLPALGNAAEGRFYSIEGGMNDTLRTGNGHIRFLSVSGLENLARLLAGVNRQGNRGKTIYLEALACSGGCVNGPAMPGGAASLDALFATDAQSPLQNSADKRANCNLSAAYPPSPVTEIPLEEAVIAAELARVGKFSRADEINCGACGYNTCRDFACALHAGKAEEAMCHNFLRRNYQRISNALIRYIPAAMVIVDEKLEIRECNRNFATLTDTLCEYDALGNLNSLSLAAVFPDFTDLFTSVLLHGGDIEKNHQQFGGRIIDLSIFSIVQGKYAGAVIRDVTHAEIHREQIAANAREVIRKNVITVQQVAHLLGEQIAEAEILLNDIAGAYAAHEGDFHGE